MRSTFVSSGRIELVENRYAQSLLGALVADAASLGVHWIYDPARIAEIADREGEAAFVRPDAKNYEGVPAFFAHGARPPGGFTQYGETLALTIQHMISQNGAFETIPFQADFAAHFGEGGAFRGYIDRPTKGTLDNIAAGHVDPSGIDDDQLPAITRLPAIVGAYIRSPEAPVKIAESVRITNVNNTANQGADIVSDVLSNVLLGAKIPEALSEAASRAPDPFRDLLSKALNAQEPDSIAYGEVTNRACHLPQGLPLAFHILQRSSSYREAVSRNLLTGGDSAGRGIFIGAVAAARCGVDGPEGIPLDWILSMSGNAQHWQACRELSRLVNN